jgi:hypothetical protein
MPMDLAGDQGRQTRNLATHRNLKVFDYSLPNENLKELTLQKI